MFQPNRILGFQPGGWATFLHPRVPWVRPWSRKDPIFTKDSGGGRRLIHPYLDDIIYPEMPNRTVGFDYDALRKTRAVLTRMEQGTAVAHYPEQRDDVVIREIWDAGSLSVSIEFYRLLKEFREEILPLGDYIGWHPTDLSAYFYRVELLDIKLGDSEVDEVEELGSKEPYMLNRSLTLVMKLVREHSAPTGVAVFLGL